ncbi:MAG: glycosyltransferase family 2 protein [Clostridiales bacterium]|nr:glycosyltransferase family 2 protein [Clostridiales bacterium]
MMKYSFIVPVYNIDESLLKRCVDKMVNQTYDKCDYEILLVDDGSKPEYAKLCDSFQNETVRVIHKENGGAASARNLGIRESKGKWIIFIDGDDYCAPETLESVDSILRQHENEQPDIIYANIHRIKIDYELKQKCLAKEDGDILSKEEVHQLLLDNIAQGYKERVVPFGCIEAWGKVYRSEFLIKNSLFFHEDMKVAEDLVFNAECLSKSPIIIYCDRFLYVAQEREGSVVKTYFPDIRKNDENYVKYLNIIGQSLNTDEFHTALNKRLIHCVLGVSTYDMAHPDNPKPFKERLSNLKEFVRSEPYKNAIKTCKLSWIQPKKNKLKLLLLRFRLEWLYLKIINIL